jgi:protein-S-isoprenylcysteine O-methyltransferase Ste14
MTGADNGTKIRYKAFNFGHFACAMNVLTLIVGLLCYVTMGAVVRNHFSSATVPLQVRLSIIVSYLGIMAFAYLMLRDRHALTPLAAALTIFVVSLALFLWAVRTTRSQRLKLAFDPEQAGFLTRAGPYKLIRHPFYASYILFWLACAVATLHPLILIFLVAFSAVNLTAAYREEHAFERSPFAAEYMKYRKTAGLLWPKLGAANE